MTQQDVLNKVAPVANQYGLPAPIWETIAQAESSFGTNNYGDVVNGVPTSFGLFQLHIGGQANAALSQGYSTAQLATDPALNAKFAIPSIANAWNSLKSSFDPNSLSWWQQFAAQSGHPGGAPGVGANLQEAQSLQSIFRTSFGSTSSAVSNPLQALPLPNYNTVSPNLSSGGNVATLAAGDWWDPQTWWDWTQQRAQDTTGAIGDVVNSTIKQYVTQTVASSWQGAVNSAVPQVQSFGLKAGIFIFALIMLVIGLVVLSRSVQKGAMA